MLLQRSPQNRPRNSGKRKLQRSLCSNASSDGDDDDDDDDAARGSVKRQKLGHPTVPPPSFWDRLSEVPLCRSALRELDRRNKQRDPGRENAKVDPDSIHRRSRRLRARRIAARRTAADDNDHRQPADRFLSHCAPTILKRVRRLATHGGPDLTDLRGCPAPRTKDTEDEMSSIQSSLGRRKRDFQSPVKRDSNTTTTRIRYKYPNGQTPPKPENLDEIREFILRSRDSLSPTQFSDEKFENFQTAEEHAIKEAQVVSEIIPLIEGDVGDRKCVASDVLFANLDHLTDGTLVPGKPDRYCGARPEQLDRRVRKDLNGHIVPSTQHDLPITPNWFLEAKGPDGSLSVAARQASYVGALSARGIHSLQTYKAPEPQYDNKAYTLTSIYHGGQLKMYASHPIQPSTPGGEPAYVMTQIQTFSLINDLDTFRQGAAAYRNGRDWAKLKRDEAIEKANKVAKNEVDDGLGLRFVSVESAATTEPTSQDTVINHGLNRTLSLHDSDTSADPVDIPLGKRHKGIRDASSNGELPGRSGEPEPATHNYDEV